MTTRDGSSRRVREAVVPKLRVNDVKFFYDVNSESRRAIKRSVRFVNAAISRLEIFTRSRPCRGLWFGVLKVETVLRTNDSEWMFEFVNFYAVKDVLGMK